MGLAVECAALGFDELLLEELCYPTKGNTYKIEPSMAASITACTVPGLATAAYTPSTSGSSVAKSTPESGGAA